MLAGRLAAQAAATPGGGGKGSHKFLASALNLPWQFHLPTGLLLETEPVQCRCTTRGTQTQRKTFPALRRSVLYHSPEAPVPSNLSTPAPAQRWFCFLLCDGSVYNQGF